MSDSKVNAENIEEFINEHDGSWQEGFRLLDKNLIKVLIDQLGGQDAFIDIYKKVLEGAKIEELNGFDTEAELLALYDANKEEFLNHADGCAKRTNTSSVSAMLAIQFEDANIDKDTVEAALNEDAGAFEDSSDNRIAICGWIVVCAVFDLFVNYDNFMMDKE